MNLNIIGGKINDWQYQQPSHKETNGGVVVFFVINRIWTITRIRKGRKCFVC